MRKNLYLFAVLAFAGVVSCSREGMEEPVVADNSTRTVSVYNLNFDGVTFTGVRTEPLSVPYFNTPKTKADGVSFYPIDQYTIAQSHGIGHADTMVPYYSITLDKGDYLVQVGMGSHDYYSRTYKLNVEFGSFSQEFEFENMYEDLYIHMDYRSTLWMSLPDDMFGCSAAFVIYGIEYANE